MKLSKRLSKIESKLRPAEERKGAHVAIIREDGTATVNLPNEGGEFQLPNEKALDSWIEENNLNEGDYLKVIVVNSQGPQPLVETFD